MIAFSKGLYERAMADSALQALIGGRFFEVEAPQETDLPYVVYSVISNTNTPTFTEKMESLRVQLSVVSRESGSTQLKTILAALEAVFDEAKFTVFTDGAASGKAENFERVTKFYDRYMADDGQGEWNGFIDYTVLYQKY